MDNASTNQISTFARSNTADFGSLFWTFDPDNHCLSDRLAKLVYHKWTFRLWMISWLIYILLYAAPLWVQQGYDVARKLLFTIPYWVSLILSFNRDACGFIIRSSEFWIKIGYALFTTILGMVLYHKVGRKQQACESPEWLGYMSRICWMIAVPLFMAIVGGMDAIPKMKYKWKCCLSLVTALYATAESIGWQFAPSRNDYIVEVKTTESFLSFHSLLANSTGMLAMFCGSNWLMSSATKIDVFQSTTNRIYDGSPPERKPNW